jgi:hypothetical protein
MNDWMGIMDNEFVVLKDGSKLNNVSTLFNLEPIGIGTSYIESLIYKCVV